MIKIIFFLGKFVLPLVMSILFTGSNAVVTVSSALKEDTTISTTPVASNGSRIVFSSDRDHCFYFNLYSMNADGSNVQRLTSGMTDDKSPSWSPDGSKIVFASNRDGNYEIYVTNATGMSDAATDGADIDAAVRLTNDPAFDWEPVWSPDGEHIAFTSNRDGNWELYLMKADGSNVTRLTNDPAYDWQPAWSPDGKRIAFTSDHDGRWEIYAMDANGSNLKRLTHPPADGRDAAWSPDGTRIAFVSTRDRAWEIYTMRADGSDVTRLTNSKFINQTPSWSADGKQIIYESNSEIMRMNADGTGNVNLSKNPAVDFHPSCSVAIGK